MANEQVFDFVKRLGELRDKTAKDENIEKFEDLLAEYDELRRQDAFKDENEEYDEYACVELLSDIASNVRVVAEIYEGEDPEDITKSDYWIPSTC